MNAIEVRNVTYETRNFSLHDVSFDVPQGYVTGFIGANGVGKTTMIRLIMNVLQQKSGEITINGKRMSDHPIALKSEIGFVYSDLYLKDTWQIGKCEDMIAPFYKKWDTSQFTKYLKRFGLQRTMKIKELSTGMKMKLSLAIAFSHHASIFILDEPTSGLDPIARHEVLEMIQDELIDANRTVFFSTHITPDLEKIADHIVYLHQGNVIFNDDMDTLRSQFKMVQGDVSHLDDELRSLLIAPKETSTRYIGLTEHADVFHELFGNAVVISEAQIEDMMVHIEKGSKGDAVIGASRGERL